MQGYANWKDKTKTTHGSEVQELQEKNWKKTKESFSRTI